MAENDEYEKLVFKDVPNSESRFEKEYLRESREESTASWEAIGDGSEGIVTPKMREQFFHNEGYMANDETVLVWCTPKKVIGQVKSLVQDGGGGKNYYDLPPNSEQLLDLIEHRNMNGNIKDIFKACYRLGQKEGTSEEYDLRKMVLYSLRELGRVTGRKDYIDLAIEVAGHHDRIYANTH